MFIDMNEYENATSKFLDNISKIIENRIKEIKQEEYDILNKDIYTRCLNGEFGLKTRNLSWIKEILITIVFITLSIIFYIKNC